MAFLAWLQGRRRELSTCRQADVDAWYAGAYTARRLTHAFPRWSMRDKLMTLVTIPHQHTRNPSPLSQQQRLATIHRLLTDNDIPLRTRVAATLMLLYAQPPTRIPQLTTDDILHHDSQVSIMLGDPPTPLPEPFAELLDKHINNQLNLHHRDQPQRPLAVSRPARRPTHDPGRGRETPTPAGNPRPQRPHSSTAAARPASTGARRRQDARLHPRPHHPTSHRGRRNLDPLRSR
ncbi:MAG: hypothetical protein ACRDQ4_17970 [Pseudonocardiaceae bacterium]